MDNSSPQSPRNLVVPLNMPIAIIIAGALIAAAIFFKGNPLASDTKVAANNPTPGQPAAGAPAPTPPPGVGDYKPVDPATDHVRGASDPKVTLIEYSDLECPFCKQFHPSTTQLLEDFPNDVQVVYRHFPLEAIHPNARIAAIGSECAAEQGKFWEFIDYIFDNTNQGAEIAKDKLPGVAQSAGVPNISAFTSCLDSGKYDDKVDEQTADAQSAGGRGTPYSVVVSESGEELPISGAQPYAQVKATIEGLL